MNPAPPATPRVALVTGGLKLGGSTTFLCNLGGELARRRVPVEVFSFEPENPLAQDFRRMNVPVFCAGGRRMIFEDRLSQILERLRGFQPSVVLATLSAVSFEVLRYLPPGIFRVGVGQSDDPAVYEMMRHYAPHLDALAVVSREMQRRASALPEFARTPVHYLPYGVAMPAGGFRPAANVQGPLRILFLGRLYREQKRVHLFPQILGRLKSSGIPFHWTIAGDGAEKSFLNRAMGGAPGQTVSFAGQISYAQVPELLRAHDLYLLTSDYEGLPLSLLEAMGAGLVPVVSDLASGIREVVDAHNGMPVPVADVEGYARAIIHLHEHREELAAKSAAAHERVKTEFSVEAMADRWLAMFPKTVSIGPWPSHWQIKTPLPAWRPFYFSPPIRFLRRLAAKWRS